VSSSTPVKPSLGSVLRENALLISMHVLGAALASVLWWPLAPIYLGFGLVAVGLYTVWVCPHCPHYAVATCPAGYPHVLRRRVEAREGTGFARQFRRGTILLCFAWFIPPILGVVALVRAWSWWTFGLLALFCLVAFVFLPSASRRLCANCDNEGCPRKKVGR
jgi:hypothetical protein